MTDRPRFGEFFNPKIVKFLGTGLLNTIFGYSIYAALIFFEIPYLAALFAATIAGVIFNFFSFGRLVFNGENGWSVFGKFVIAYFLIYLVNSILLEVLVQSILLNPYIGQIVCIPISVLLSWFLMSKWVYKND